VLSSPLGLPSLPSATGRADALAGGSGQGQSGPFLDGASARSVSDWSGPADAHDGEPGQQTTHEEPLKMIMLIRS